MDVLSEVLKAVKLEGAFYYNGEFSAPWSFQAPPSRALAGYLAPGCRHVIIYHLLTEGSGYARLPDGPRVPLEAGDIVIFPHGDPHIMGNGAALTPLSTAPELGRILSEGLKVARMGGGGEVTRFVCGYMACDPDLCQIVLGCLPPLLKIHIRNDPAGEWLENSIRFSVAQAGATRPGGEAVLAKLSEALFVEALRRYIALMPPEQTGWLAGARDPEVGKALALLHQQPGHPWTIEELARAVGVSRSVLAERFRHYLGEPPMAYLTRWRLRLGAQMLTTTSRSVAQIAAEVGYASEAAFNRAFKRALGRPPARFRSQSKPGRTDSAGAA